MTPDSPTTPDETPPMFTPVPVAANPAYGAAHECTPAPAAESPATAPEGQE